MFKYIALFALIAVAAASAVSKSDIEVKVQESDIRPDGSNYVLELSNGARVEQVTDDKGNAKGSFTWTDPKGEVVELTFVADQNGYQPQSKHLPTPPPTPAAILKSLEWLAAHPPAAEDKDN